MSYQQFSFIKRAFKSLSRVELNKHSFCSLLAALIIVLLFILDQIGLLILLLDRFSFRQKSIGVVIISFIPLYKFACTALQVTFSEIHYKNQIFSILNILANYIFLGFLE